MGVVSLGVVAMGVVNASIVGMGIFSAGITTMGLKVWSPEGAALQQTLENSDSSLKNTYAYPTRAQAEAEAKTAALEKAIAKDIEHRRQLKYGSERLRELAAKGVECVDENRVHARSMLEALQSNSMQAMLTALKTHASSNKSLLVHGQAIAGPC